MKKSTDLILICLGVTMFLSILTFTIIQNLFKENDIYYLCGTITGLDKTIEPIKFDIIGDDRASFDFRTNPGKLDLYRCEKDTPFSSIK